MLYSLNSSVHLEIIHPGTAQGLADFLHKHVPKLSYMRHAKQVIARTQIPAHAAVGSVLFL